MDRMVAAAGWAWCDGTVPTGSQLELVSVVGHSLEVREALQIDDRIAVDVVVMHPRGGVGTAAGLPVVIKSDVAVTEVAERSGLAVDSACALDHAVHDALNQALVHVTPVEIPRPPAEWRRQRKPVVVPLRTRKIAQGKRTNRKQKGKCHPAEQFYD